MSSTISARPVSRATTSEVSEIVLQVLTSDEQSLRTIREAVAQKFGVDPSAMTSPVARALRKLVDEGAVERPRRGFYSVALVEEPEPKAIEQKVQSKAIAHKAKPKAIEPKVIGRKLEPAAFVPSPAKSVEPTSCSVAAAVEPESVIEPAALKPIVVEPKTEEPTAVEPKTVEPEAVEQNLVEPADQITESSVQEPPASEQEVGKLEVAEPQVIEITRLPELSEESKDLGSSEQVAASVLTVARPRRVRSRVQARRDRRWTPEGSMGMQGMVMIILWFVVAGVAIFALNNVYGILAAIGLAIVFWFFHIAMKPKAKKKQVDANSSVPSHP